MKTNPQTKDSFLTALESAMEAPTRRLPDPIVAGVLKDGCLEFVAANRDDFLPRAVFAFPADRHSLERLTGIGRPIASGIGGAGHCERIVEAVKRVLVDTNEGLLPYTEEEARLHAARLVERLAAEGYGPDEADAERKGRPVIRSHQADCFVRAGTITVSNAHGGEPWVFSFRDTAVGLRNKADIFDTARVPTTQSAAREYAKQRTRELLGRGFKVEGVKRNDYGQRTELLRADWKLGKGEIYVENEHDMRANAGWQFSFSEIAAEVVRDGYGLAAQAEWDCRQRQAQARTMQQAQEKAPLVLMKHDFGGEAEGQPSPSVFLVNHSDADSGSVLAYVASSSEKAHEFMRTNQNYGGQGLWWWAVERLVVDNTPLQSGQDRAFNYYAPDGTPCPPDTSITDFIEQREAALAPREDRPFLVTDNAMSASYLAADAREAVGRFLSGYTHDDVHGAPAEWSISAYAADTLDIVAGYQASVNVHGEIEAVPSHPVVDGGVIVSTHLAKPLKTFLVSDGNGEPEFVNGATPEVALARFVRSYGKIDQSVLAGERWNVDVLDTQRGETGRTPLARYQITVGDAHDMIVDRGRDPRATAESTAQTSAPKLMSRGR